jgi:hypothetical protein
VYTVAGRTYRQPFVAYDVDDERLGLMAAEVGLQVVRYLDDARTWVTLGHAH